MHGPTAAVIASLQRINWKMDSPTTITTDLGHQLDMLLDPPIVVAKECKEGVRRWRLQLANKILPGLIPAVPDIGPAIPSEHDRLLCTISGISSMIKGKRCKKAAGTIAKDWHPRAKGDLVSAMVGGQWTQARKAQVPEWQIMDNSCQLCHSAVGTIEHRFTCKTTMPTAGWPKPPAAAGDFLLNLARDRKRFLQQRALAVIRLPPTTRHAQGQFHWLKPPDHNNLEFNEAVWYCDGSLIHGKWAPLRTTGFGIVVTSVQGKLLAYGMGWPPSWCSTAAAAEAWALHIVIETCPFPPSMRTDYQALLKTAQAGTQSATGAARPLARVWKRIAANVGADISLLMDRGLLVWLPAHTNHNAVGEVLLSNGTRLSHVDWRANRLVDQLAKVAAKALCAPIETVKLLDGCDAACAHAAALLGIVTHAANNHKTVTYDEEGKVRTTIQRDSTDKPKKKVGPPNGRERESKSRRKRSSPPAAPPRQLRGENLPPCPRLRTTRTSSNSVLTGVWLR